MSRVTECIPMRVGEECTDMVNGTCRSRVPKIVDCGRLEAKVVVTVCTVCMEVYSIEQ